MPDNPGQLSAFDFSGQVVIVTGASSNVGAGIAQVFAAAGASVAVHYNTGIQEAQKLVEQITSARKIAAAFQADVSRADEVERLITQVVARFGRIDVLINNAGIYPSTPLLKISPEEWQHVLDTNLNSAFYCTQAAAKRLVDQGQAGSIINIASIEAQNPAPGHAHYSAAKAGLVMLTRTAARELGQYGIRVNAVSPGLIWKEGLERTWPEGVNRWLRTAPLQRLGLPADIAEACLFLASPAAQWITGENLVVDGGILTCQGY